MKTWRPPRIQRPTDEGINQNKEHPQIDECGNRYRPVTGRTTDQYPWSFGACWGRDPQEGAELLSPRGGGWGCHHRKDAVGGSTHPRRSPHRPSWRVGGSSWKATATSMWTAVSAADTPPADTPPVSPRFLLLMISWTFYHIVLRSIAFRPNTL